ncbi:MAG: PIN domain-containing protein [Thermoguttaceae bacterium]|nr:PIN domain-containing protein [Thermoguttaceae bacterium]
MGVCSRKSDRACFDGTIVPLLNEQIVNEYEEVLNRPRFQFQSEMASVAALRSEIERVGFFVDDPEKLEWTLPDFKDRIFYEVVMEKRKTDEAYLITCNSKHFPIEPYVVTPRQMLDIITNAGE